MITSNVTSLNRLNLYQEKNAPTITDENNEPIFDDESTEDEAGVQRYEGSRFTTGCDKFDKSISNNYLSIKVEFENVLEMYAVKY